MKTMYLLTYFLIIAVLHHSQACVICSKAKRDTGCDGSVELVSTDHTYTATVYSNKLRARRVKRRKIKLKHPETQDLLPFDAVTLTGNCCWRVSNAFLGGQSTTMNAIGSYQTGWVVRAVELLDECN